VFGEEARGERVRTCSFGHFLAFSVWGMVLVTTTEVRPSQALMRSIAGPDSTP
jgi:hypothetical protein